MNETTQTTSSTTSSPPAGADDVWGVNRPPALPPTGPTLTGPTATGPAPTGPAPLDRTLSTLSRSPLRRDSAHGVVGGVAAGLARTLNVSANAVRVSAVLLALFFGLGVGAYLIAWAVLPDDHGRTHAEQAVRDGRPGSLAVVGLATLPVLGVVAGVLGTGWPLLLAAAVVALVVARRKGHLPHHTHG
jgi:phage shock protein PspC (stress-responsive transcriptional regulator)